MFLSLAVAVHYSWSIFDFTFHGETLLVQWLFFGLFNLLYFTKLGQFRHFLCKNQGFSITKFFWRLIAFRYFYRPYRFFYKLFHELNLIQSYVWGTFIFVWFGFVFVENWLGVVLPKFLAHLPLTELTAATADINTTIGLALLVVISSFYQRYKSKGIWFVTQYIKPFPFLLPLNIIEEFTKPLSLSFRLFGNILADELTCLVITSLVPFAIPIPIIALGLFAGYIQTIIFINLTFDYIFE